MIYSSVKRLTADFVRLNVCVKISTLRAFTFQRRGKWNEETILVNPQKSKKGGADDKERDDK